MKNYNQSCLSPERSEKATKDYIKAMGIIMRVIRYGKLQTSCPATSRALY